MNEPRHVSRPAVDDHFWHTLIWDVTMYSLGIVLVVQLVVGVYAMLVVGGYFK